MMRRAFLLSIDAIIAVGILFVLSAFLTSLSLSYSSPELEYQRLYYSGKDVMNVIETVNLSAAIELMPVNFSSDCNITSSDMDKTILDVLGYLWAQNSTVFNECGENLTREIFASLLPSGFGYEVLMDDVSIYKVGEADDSLSRLSTIVSGYELGKPVSGYFASAFISRMSKSTSSYVYFGGYVGDGNITKIITLPEDANVTKVYLELTAGTNFTLMVNGYDEGDYYPSSFNMTANSWTVCNSYSDCGNFSDGENTVNILFINNDSNYIGGGYLKINYNTSKPDTLPFSLSNETAVKYYYFPGITGVINLYSSFYVPGTLNSMLIHQHYDSGCTANCTIFLNIGNVTVYESNETGEKEFNITNSTLFSMLANYSWLNDGTIPIRMGLRNLSYEEGGSGTGDSVLVTDVSGSMEDCADYSGNSSCTYDWCRWWSSFFGTCLWWDDIICDNPGSCVLDECNTGTTRVRNHQTCDTKLYLAKDGNKVFVNVVLNYSGNRVGLVNYSDSTLDMFSLTNNNITLHNAIESYEPGGGTCICCGIISATTLLDTESNASRRKSMVVMSDGQANVRCNNAFEDKDGDFDIDEDDDTIQAACDAYNNYNIDVYTIGYGSDSNNQTMNLTAQCGNGEYFYSNTTALAETYREIAESIAISYFAQTVSINFGGAFNSTLYPDAYIEFNYIPNDFLGYGEVSLSLESERFGGNVSSPKEGIFYIPSGSRLLDAKVTSYSSEFWTTSLDVNNSATGVWENVYNLSDYTSDYGNKGEFVELGDPFVVHIPINKLVVAENNSVRINTGYSTDDMTGGSPDDRVIFYVGVSGIVGYGDIYSTLGNASSDAIQRLQSQLSEFNITMLDIETPSNYVSELPSLWGPSVLEIRIWS